MFTLNGLQKLQGRRAEEVYVQNDAIWHIDVYRFAQTVSFYVTFVSVLYVEIWRKNPVFPASGATLFAPDRHSNRRNVMVS